MNDDDKSILKKILIISLITLPILLIIGIFVDIILFSVIYLMIPLTIFGFWGGIWLWEQLATSDYFKKGAPIIAKVVGTVAIATIFFFIVAGFYLCYFGDIALIISIVNLGTMLMFFVAIYNVGYLISIWKPFESGNKDKSGFKIQKKKSLILIIVVCAWILFSLLLTFTIFISITGNYFTILIYFVIGGVAPGVGWIFWEHLKETNLLSGDFLKTLKILSITFEAPVILLTILGFISNFLQDIFLFRIILLIYLLLFQLMVGYFIGLISQVLKN